MTAGDIGGDEREQNCIFSAAEICSLQFKGSNFHFTRMPWNEIYKLLSRNHY